MSLEEQKENQIPLGPTAEEIKQRWKKFSGIYVQFDSAPQTFFYSLANMLKLDQAKNILQIACGAGKLIPHVLDLKSRQTFYYATDISQEMIGFARNRLQNHFKKYQSTLTFQEWMHKQKIQFGIVNGEEKLPKNIRFDRIICNLVLMLTTNPKKMLQNLYDHAEQGCLMGLTVWGSKKGTNIFSYVEELLQKQKLLPPNYRSAFFLADQIQDLVEECGWQKVLTWNQNVVFPVIEHSYENLHPFVEKQILGKFPKSFHSRIIEKVDQWINQQKCGLTFTGKLMIVRKK